MNAHLRNFAFALFIILFCFKGATLAVSVSSQLTSLQLTEDPVPVALKLISEDRLGCEIQFELNQLSRDIITVNGTTFQALTILGGGLSGQNGAPGLPTYSGMIAVPAGHTVDAVVVNSELRVFPDMKIFPVQPEKAESFHIDHNAYSPQSGSRSQVSFTISLGEPAILHGQPVVSFTVNPVHFRAEDNLVTVASRLSLRFQFKADGKGKTSRRVFNSTPRSFSRLFDDVLINSLPSEKSGSTNDLGTYLVITPPSGQSSLAPLLDWRRRQGYNVLVGNTGTIGPSAVDIKSYIQNIYDTVEPPLEYVVMIGDANGSLTTPTFIEYISGYHGEGDHYYTTLDGGDILSDIHIGRLTARDPTELSAIITKIITYETNPPTLQDPDWFNRASVVGDPSSSGITTIYVNQWLKEQLQTLAFTQVDSIFGGNFPGLMYTSINQGLSVFGYRGFYDMSGFSLAHITTLSNESKLPFAVIPTCDTGSFLTQTTCRSEAFLRNPGGGAIGAIGMSTLGTHTRYNNCLYHGIWEGALNSGDHHLGAALSRGKLEVYNNYFLAEPGITETWAVWANLMGDPATDLWLDTPSILLAEFPTELPVGAGSVPVMVTSNGNPVAGALVALYKANEIRVTGTTDDFGQVNLPIHGPTEGTLLVTVTKHNCKPVRGWLSLGEVSAHATLTEIALDDGSSSGSGNGDLLPNPGESLNIRCALTNEGINLAANVTASLISRDPMVTIVDGNDSFGDIPAGQTVWSQDSFEVLVSGQVSDQYAVAMDLVAINDDTGTFGPLEPGELFSNAVNHFTLKFADDCFAGHLATFELRLTLPDGLIRTTVFQMTVGEISHTDPIGPDNHGYYAIDNTDTSYDQAPVYDWVEINPAYGGPGTDTGMSDDYFEQDKTSIFDLPFPFSYYGTEFNKISICTNGWIAMGATNLRHYRNFTLPSAGSPDAMIAPFWDNLYTSGDHKVYYWYDEANGRFIVEWSRMHIYYGNYHYSGLQDFQVILHDPAVHPTSNGDGEILFQYATVTNEDNINGYATVGIQNLTGDDGLLYTYWNQYASGAAPLEAGRAILFTPGPSVQFTTCEVSPNHFTLTMAPDQTRQETLVISNNGDPDSELSYLIQKTDPNAPMVNGAAKDLTGSVMTCSQSVYPIGEIVDLEFSATNNSPDNEYLVFVSLDFPAGVSVIGSTNLVNSYLQTLTYNQASGNGAEVVWEDGFVIGGNTAICTMTLDFSNYSGALVLPYTMTGDNFGGEPHTVQGTISLLPSGPSVSLQSPNGGEQWAIGDVVEIQFLAGGGPELLELALDRNDGNGWQTIIENIPATETSATWLVDGPISAQCRMRLSDSNDATLFDISDNYFTIGRDLGWVMLDHDAGVVVAGTPNEVILTFNTQGLEPGSYLVDLQIWQMANGLVMVPIVLIISDDLSGSAELPPITGLKQNRPNPFNPQTEIGFSIEAGGNVKLSIYNARGQLVRSLVNRFLEMGEHKVIWQGRDDSGRLLSSGVYYYRLETTAGKEVKKMVYVK